MLHKGKYKHLGNSATCLSQTQIPRKIHRPPSSGCISELSRMDKEKNIK